MLIVLGVLILWSGSVRAIQIKGTLNTSKIGVTTTNDSLKNGLVGHWTFDGKNMLNGKALDISTSGFNGSPTNIATSTFYAPGKIGQGLNFDGVDDYISFGNIGLMDQEPFSVSVWFYANNPVSGNNQVLVSSSDGQGLTDTTTDAQYLMLNSSGQITAFSHRSTAGAGAVGTVASANTWYHAVGVYENSALRHVYVNGVFIASNTGGEAVNTPNNLRIGSRNHSGGEAQFFDGIIDDVRVYNRVLSASEITKLYNIGTSRFAESPTDWMKDGLVGYWTFDGKDFPNGKATDVSGNGNSGSPAGIATSTFYAPGKIGQGVRFDSDRADRILTSLQLNSTASGLSTSMWVKTNNESLANQVLFAEQTSGAVTLTLFYRGSENAFSYINEYNVTDSQGGWNYTLDEGWHHIVLVEPYSGGDVDNASFYVDGVLVTSLFAGVNLNPSTANFIIGNRKDADLAWSGNIDDVRVYNRTLSANEVLQLYNKGRF